MELLGPRCGIASLKSGTPLRQVDIRIRTKHQQAAATEMSSKLPVRGQLDLAGSCLSARKPEIL
jgi:hypothetical protein